MKKQSLTPGPNRKVNKIWLPVLLLGLLLSISRSYAGIGICLDLGFGCGETLYPQGSDVTIVKKANGDQITRITTVSNRQAPPARPLPYGKGDEPQRVTIYNAQNKLIGGATQIDPGGKIFVTARHVLAGKNKLDFDLVNAKKTTPMTHEDFVAFQVTEQNAFVDVVFLVPRNSKTDIRNGEDLRAALKQLFMKTRIDQSWYSWQYGILNGTMLDGEASSVLRDADFLPSKPSSAEVQSAFFWLNSDDRNFTSAGSSGSVIWQASPRKASDLRPVGVIQCMEQPARTEQRVSVQSPKPRVLSLSALVVDDSLNWDSVSLAELLDGPPQPSAENCKPIDRKGGGGY